MPGIEILNLLESLTKKKTQINSRLVIYSKYCFVISSHTHTHTHVEDALLFLSMLTYPFPP